MFVVPVILVILTQCLLLVKGIDKKINARAKVEHCAVPTNYLRGYLETMFNVELEEHRTRIEGLVVFIAGKSRLDAWR